MTAQFSQYPMKLLEAWLPHYIAYNNVPSVAVAVTTESEIIYAKGFGYADVENRLTATADTLYRIMSITKPFTATAIMALRDDGQLSLETAIVDLLPWFTPQYTSLEDPAITVRHLLTHSSGLPRDVPLKEWTDYIFTDLDTVSALFENIELVAQPGTLSKYSNLGYVVLGAVIEAVSKRSYAQYIQETILKPLGMNDTLVDAPAGQTAKLAKGYAKANRHGQRATAPLFDANASASAFGMTSTAIDMAKFLQRQLQAYHADNHLVLDNSTIHEMHTPHNPDKPIQMEGLGFQIFDIDGMPKAMAHSGASDGFFTGISFVPELKLGFVVLTNCAYGPFGKVSLKLLEWLSADLQATQERDESPTPLHAQLAGNYSSGYIDYVVLPWYGELVAIDLTETEHPLRRKSVLQPISEEELIYLWHNPTSTNGLHGEKIKFEVEDGQITGFTSPSQTTYRRIERWE